MMTQLGRVVYDRKKNIMLPRDIARILSSYSLGIPGAEFAKFCLNVLELTIKKEIRTRDFEINFWRYFLNAFTRGALEEIFVPKKFRETFIETKDKPIETDTRSTLEKQADAKRDKQREILGG